MSTSIGYFTSYSLSDSLHDDGDDDEKIGENKKTDQSVSQCQVNQPINNQSLNFRPTLKTRTEIARDADDATQGHSRSSVVVPVDATYTCDEHPIVT